MKTYCVTWTIDIEAETPEQAAQEAQAIHRQPSYLTTLYDVTEDSGAHHVVHLLTDEPVIYDHGGDDFVDRYTVFLQPNHPDTDIRRCYLGLSEGGRAVSQWGEVNSDDWGHLGKKITLDDVSEDTRNHILARAKET